ncbi:hypothetical protein F2Q68_00044565 [Brassica cretica]|uniref:Uncharacterized protein n=1 Tax=Brassica cretica TaxID=69181 RepID=A0A8S9LKJ0_BRACR|nr:hypothetical protein F2Q68_00044565 [Brassica cretica]
MTNPSSSENPSHLKMTLLTQNGVSEIDKRGTATPPHCKMFFFRQFSKKSEPGSDIPTILSKSKDRNEEKIPNLASELLIADTSVLHQSPRLAVLKNLPTASDFQELPPTVMITGSRTFSYREED